MNELAQISSDPPDPDFSDIPINIIVPADRTTFEIPTFFTINDDNIDEYDQSFAIVAEIGRDVPENISCFQTYVGHTECFGRLGATEIRITDNDCKFLSSLYPALRFLSNRYDYWFHSENSKSLREHGTTRGRVFPTTNSCSHSEDSGERVFDDLPSSSLQQLSHCGANRRSG